MTKRRRTLPPVSPKVPAELRPLISAMTEILETGEGVRGDPLDRKITLRDLVDSGIGKMQGGVRPGSGGGLIPGVEPLAPDLSTPPPPQGFAADGSFFGRINLSWQIPSELYRNHAYTNIYRSEEDNFANAVVVGREVGAFFSDYVRNDALDPQDPLQLKGYYYWITFTSSSDVEGPPNATAGLWAQPLPDLNYVMDLLSEQIDDSHLADSLRQEIELITAPESITGSVSSRIAEERDDRIAALQDAYDAIDAEAAARTANINTEQQARVDADSVLSTQITELSVKIDSLPVFSSGFEPGNDFTQWAADATATITADAEAYTGLQSALITSTATAPSSATPEGATAIIPEGTATAFAGRRVRISGYAKQPATGAATEFALAYATGDGDSGWQVFQAGAEWTAFEFLYDVPADSTTVTDTLAIWGDTSGNGNGILIDAISVQSATSEVPEFTAALEAEQQARADGDAALASDIQTLTAIADDNAADIASEAQVRASADETLASDIQATYAQFDDLRGEIVEEARVRATEDELLAGMQRVISAAGETQAASLYTLSEIRISEQEVVVQRVEGLEASMGDATAAIQQEETARVTADDALSQQITTVQSTLGDDVAAVQQSLTTNVERIDGELVALGAEYTVQVQANGLVGGFGIYNDGTTIDAGFDVDRFWIGSSQDDKRKPFVVDGGVSYIDEAMIRDASIQEGKLGPITIGKLHLDDGTPITTVGGLIRADAIDVDNLSVAEAATFTGIAQSANYSPGAYGWIIQPNGNVEFNQGVFNGQVEFKNVTGAGALASKDSLGYWEVTGTKPPTDADKTGSNTAYDTARVAGSSASNVRQWALNGNNANTRVNDWVRPNTTLINGNKIYTGDAYVDTLQLKGQAVTIPASAYTAGEKSIADGSWTTVQSVSFNPEGGGVDVFCVINVEGYSYRSGSGNNSTNVDVYARLLRNGSVVADYGMVFNARVEGQDTVVARGKNLVPFGFRYGGLSGTQTFAIQMYHTHRVNTGYTWAKASNRFMSVKGVKR